MKLQPEKQSLILECEVNNEVFVKAWAFMGEVIPDSVKVDDGSKKIEISLNKSSSGMWAKVEAAGDATKPLYEKWSRMKLPDEEEEKNEGLDNFLKKIYANASEEARRAMNKSFQESGGTVLSTNWEDVGQRKVEPQPPK